ncbi:MAG: HAD hydrolase-like protein [Magnetococcales bacterium]|nr:HAD hydrolase-like protein [Magnetococcales bacterium]NGZ29168.1 HAD hydrolase-like protein [Magnetococcales bacterium]
MKGGRGLFVDMDGTIADSLPVLQRVYYLFLSNHGQQGSQVNFAELNGIPLREVVQNLKEKYGLPGTIDELLQEYRQLALATYTQEVVPIIGAEELLQEAVQQGWQVAVVTSNLREYATNWLNHTGLSRWVTCIVGADSVERGKPFPDPFLLALSQTDCLSYQSLAVEDSLIGARSALQAGLKTVVRIAAYNKNYDWPDEVIPVTHLQEIIPMLHQQEGSHVPAFPV